MVNQSKLNDKLFILLTTLTNTHTFFIPFILAIERK